MCEMTEVLEFPGRWECVTCGHEWERLAAPEASPAPGIVKDAHGTVLADGDIVAMIKDLKLGGGSQVLKVGTKSKPKFGWSMATMKSTARWMRISIGLKDLFCEESLRDASLPVSRRSSQRKESFFSILLVNG